MAVKLRLARHGAKKRPYYRLVAADQRFSRDGRFLEHVGSYDPNHDPPAVTLKRERIQYWLGEGAQVTDRVSRMLEAAGVLEKKERNNPQKAVAGQKMQERAEEKAAKAAEAAEAAAEPVEEVAEAPAEAEAEAPVEAEAEAPAEAEAEAPAEAEAEAEAPAEDAAAEDAEK